MFKISSYQINRRCLFAALLCSTTSVMPSFAFAQDLGGDKPSFADENNVDLGSRQYSFPNTENSFNIGDLTFSHSVGYDPTNVIPDNYYSRIYVTQGSSGVTGGIELQYGKGPIWFGHSSKFFTQPNYKVAKYVSIDGDGSYIVFQGSSALSNEYIYYAADGAIYHYKTFVASNINADFYLSKIEYNDGRHIAITNRVKSDGSYVGPQTISSNRGYMLQFEYQSDTSSEAGYSKISAVNGYNLAVDKCAEGALHCIVVAGRPRSTFTYDTNSLTETNPLGKVSHFYLTTTSTISQLHIRLPDGNAGNYDNISATWSGNDYIRVNRGGKNWSYQWFESLNSDNIVTVDVYSPDQVDSLYSVYVDNSHTFYNRLVSVIKDFGAANQGFKYDYDSQNRLTQTTVLPVGSLIKYKRDANGNVTERREVSATPVDQGDLVTTAVYPATCANLLVCHEATSITDPSGYTTNYTFAENGQPLTVVLPAANNDEARQTTSYGYSSMQAYYKNSAGSVVASGLPISLLTSATTCMTAAICSGTPNERKTSISYGPQTVGAANHLDPSSVTLASGDDAISSRTSATYDVLGNLAAVDGPLTGTADTTAMLYDVMGHQVGVIGPDPGGDGTQPNAAMRTTYDDNGRPVLVEQGTTAGQTTAAWAAFSPASSVATKYDAYGRKAWVKQQSGSTAYSVTQYNYDAKGRVNCAAVRMDLASWDSANDACTVKTVGGVSDRVTQFTYDYADRVTSEKAGVGTADAATVRTTQYTPNGLVSSIIDANNNRTDYTYDGFGRPVETRYPSTTTGANASSTSDYEHLTYEDNVHVTQRRQRDGITIGYTYDHLGQILTQSPVGEDGVRITYNVGGQMTKVTKGTLQVELTYDALGRMTKEVQPFGSMSSQYDAAGNRTRETWDGEDFYVDYVYDNTGQVTDIREKGVTTGVQALAHYTYDILGRRGSVTYGNGTTRTYAYDNVNRLAGLQIDLAGTASDVTIGKVGSTGTVVTYNAASQILGIPKNNTTYAYGATYNVARSYTSNGLNQYTAAGSVSFGYDARGNLTSSGSSSYTYDKLNEMTSAPNGVTMSYDPLGRLREYDTSTATRFVYDGSHIASEVDGAGNVLRRYVYGPGSDEPIVWYEGVGVADRRFLQADERGSIVAVSDSSGNAIGINTYDEYGIPGAANIGRFQFTGQAWFSEAGLYSFKARMYSPTLGRFMQTDPIGYSDGINWYNYAGGDPINASDPSGLAGECLTSGSCPTLTGSATFTPPSSGGADWSNANWGAGSGLYAYGTGLGLSVPILGSLISYDFRQFANTSKPQRGSWLRRAYRYFSPDVCTGKGTNEGAGVPGGYDPYRVDEKGSLAQLYSHVFPEHGNGTASGRSEFSSDLSKPGYLIGAIITAIQTQPARGSGGSAVYTVNTGQYVGYDAIHGGGTDYLTVIMGREIDGMRTLRTAYPGCR